SRQDMDSDLQSYIRLGVPPVEFGALTREPFQILRQAWQSGDDDAAVREARLFACEVRAAGGRERSRIADDLGSGRDDVRAAALARAQRMAADAARLRQSLSELFGVSSEGASLRESAAAWVDEDISKAVETVLGQLTRDLTDAHAPRQLIRTVRQAAVAEARYRLDAGLDGVGAGTLSKRDVEHLEFRRHVLKRFTSSALWLEAHARNPAGVAINVFYAIAAGVAMAFALAMAFVNGRDAHPEQFWIWAGAVVVAYAGKDRLKAWLQGFFASYVSKKYPHRRWLIRDPERQQVVGRVDEWSGFVRDDDMPADVLEARRSTGRQPIEDRSAPETVIRHHKSVLVRPATIQGADARFRALTEVFRLDLRRWLSHTDDPKRQILYADPISGHIRSAVAPRVYNIGVVYRLRQTGDAQAPWHRVRVVVSRKGIRRIEHVIPNA
ncbi:MAG: hypothetical protein KC417_06045, partial [Myxococcales bacterium]|nr:hypothetical protein [Myxococcales bacterium]